MLGIPSAAWDRFEQLRKEEKEIDTLLSDQVGTTIPKLFSQANSYLINPSSIGTALLSRMIETDDAVSSSVQFKVLMILSKVGDYSHKKPEVNDFVQGFLADLVGPTWAEAKEAMLSAKGYGFSVSEFTCKLDGKMRKVPKSISTYHPSTIAFEADEYGRITENGVLQFIQQQTQFSNPNSRMFGVQYGSRLKNPFETPTDRVLPYRVPFVNQFGLARIPRKKVIHMTNLPMFSFGSPYGKTELRTAHLAWALKQFTMRQTGIAVKRNANTFLWGTAPQGAANVEIEIDGVKKKMNPVEALTYMLRDRESDDSIVTGPETNGYKLSPINSSANLDQFLNTMRDLDVRIFRCFLLPSLVMTDGSAGSRALGDKHFEIVGHTAAEEAQKFGECVINDMIKPLIIENFGPQSMQEGGYGSFKARPQTAEEREKLAGIFSTLTTAGILKNHVKEDMKYMREALSLPKDTDTSFDLGTRPEEINDADLVPSGTEAPVPVKKGEEQPAPAATEPAAPAAEEPAPENILNGAQVTALKDLVKDVIDGKIPRETAIEIMKSAFKYDAETANRILGKPGFEPKAEPTPEPSPQAEPKKEEE